MKTKGLTGWELDLAVAKCEGSLVTLVSDWVKAWDYASQASFIRKHGGGDKWVVIFGMGEAKPVPCYSTNWAQGGLIIERLKGFELKHWLDSKPELSYEAHIHNYEGDWVQFGPTPLIAAMRCFVASKQPTIDTSSSIATHPDYWDCNCDESYMHTKRHMYCKRCGAHAEDQPDSRVDELAKFGTVP